MEAASSSPLRRRNAQPATRRVTRSEAQRLASPDRRQSRSREAEKQNEAAGEETHKQDMAEASRSRDHEHQSTCLRKDSPLTSSPLSEPGSQEAGHRGYEEAVFASPDPADSPPGSAQSAKDQQTVFAMLAGEDSDPPCPSLEPVLASSSSDAHKVAREDTERKVRVSSSPSIDGANSVAVSQKGTIAACAKSPRALSATDIGRRETADSLEVGEQAAPDVEQHVEEAHLASVTIAAPGDDRIEENRTEENPHDGVAGLDDQARGDSSGLSGTEPVIPPGSCEENHRVSEPRAEGATAANDPRFESDTGRNTSHCRNETSARDASGVDPKDRMAVDVLSASWTLRPENARDDAEATSSAPPPSTADADNAVISSSLPPTSAFYPVTSSQEELLMGLDSEDFDDFLLGDEPGLTHPGCTEPRGSPTLATRGFKRTVSKSACAGERAGDTKKPASRPSRRPGLQGDGDGFADDSGFWDGVEEKLGKAIIPTRQKDATAAAVSDPFKAGARELTQPMGFMTLRGRPFEVSAKAMAAAKNKLRSWAVADEATETATPPSADRPPPLPQIHAVAQRVAGVSSAAPRTPLASRALNHAMPQSLSYAPASLPKQAEAVAIASSPVRAPRRPAFSTVAASASNSPRGPAEKQGFASSSQTRPNATHTPKPAARVALGLTPRSYLGSKSATRPRFTTPFKKEVPSAAVPSSSQSCASGRHHATDAFKVPEACMRTPKLITDDIMRPQPAELPRLAPRTATPLPRPPGPCLFDLTKSPGRQGLADYGVRPGSQPLEVVAAHSEEIPLILQDPGSAVHFVFNGPNGTALGPQEALVYLESLGASHVDLKWISNHWAQILWKLAAITAGKLDELDQRFTWDELVRQLRYRYEREINLAQRSAVKRIQEHDSPPNSPMVLCVMKVLKEAVGDPQYRRVTWLELSDGWYTIRARVDDVLARAVQRGRIRCGSKLAISSAQLESISEGSDVLEALEKSHLKIWGNATSLARWDARLGFVRQPFISTLRSLTSEGGLVSCMDVVVTRLYPIAYVDSRRADGARGSEGLANARSEADEAAEAEMWATRLEETKHAIETAHEGRLMALERIVAALPSAAGDSDSDPEAEEEKYDELLDRMFKATDVHAFVRDEVPVTMRVALGRVAVERLSAEQVMGAAEAEEELRRQCPPREVRSFRICRFVDARVEAGRRASRAARSARSVQLTVWDAAKMAEGEGALVEGARYLVSNLVPTAKGSWRPKPDDEGDIFLSTRRDTRWIRLA